MATEPLPINDPFASLDPQQTFVRPRPAAWGAPGRDGGATPESAYEADEAAEGAPVPEHGLNPLVAVANRLLMLAPRIRQTHQVADVAALRATLAQGIRDFVAAAQARGVAPERVMAARYVLCTVLDEAAADTPWGGAGVWGRHSLLTEFHNEASGGEKVFQLMARLAEKADANLDLLELIYAALSLGFEGRYRVVPNGRGQLDAVRARLGQILRQHRGAYPAELAQHWQGVPAAQRRALSWLPLAVSGAAVLLVLGAVYAGFAKSLASRADPVYASIQRLRLPPPVPAVMQPAPKPRLAVFLEADVRAGLVAVQDAVDRSVVTVHGDGLFAPGSATLLPGRDELIHRIADAMARVGGNVVVTGHTDNTPIRTARFPSNWHLSEERARDVRDRFIAAGIPAERIRAEGRADGEPVAPNDTEAHRAMNRRVEITLVAPEANPAVRAAAPAGPASR